MTANVNETAQGRIMKPIYVTAGVVVLVSDDAPTGLVLCAGFGAFSSYRMVETKGVFLAREGLTAEIVRDALPRITDEAVLRGFHQATDHAANLMTMGGLPPGE